MCPPLVQAQLLLLVGTASRDPLIVREPHWPEALAVLRGLRDAARKLLEGGEAL